MASNDPIHGRKRRQRLIREGKCPRCMSKLEPGYRLCAGCRVKMKSYLKENYDSMKENEVCVRCLKRPAMLGKVACYECTVAKSDRRKARYERYKAAGLCIDCGLPTMEGSLVCQRHSVKRKKYWRDAYLRKQAKKKLERMLEAEAGGR